jgi:Bacterial regulatory helix-turn-helix proteins, AraC family./Glycosyl hydrolases family 39.
MYNLTTNPQYSRAIIYKLTEPVYYRSTGVIFLCMLTGDATLSLNTDIFNLTDKDVVLLRPDEYYNLKSDTSAFLLELSFDYIFFKETFSGDYDRLFCNSVMDKDHDYSRLRMYIAKTAIVHYSDVFENRFYLLSNVYQLFHYINNEFVTSLSANDIPASKLQQKTNKIVSYLNKNYYNSISLQDLALYMDFTPQYLEKLMKQSLNSTFYDYLNQIRLQASLDLLKHSDQSISFISLSCGFSNLSSFQNLFSSKYGISPAAYRENILSQRQQSDSKENAILTDSLAKDFLTNSIQINNYNNSIIEISNNITAVVNTNKSKPLKPIWKDLINLGLCNNFERPSFRLHLNVLQSELGFKYGRIQGILDIIDCYVTDISTEYNLNKVYRIIDFLSSIHMYPMFELGNKSPTIYKDYKNELPSDRKGSEYNDTIHKLLPVFLMNCINRYGFLEVSNWKFELWMEHNDFMTIIENPKDYVRRFRFVYETIKKYIPSAMVGGPGFNTFISIDYFEALLKELNKFHILPDFISFYLYPYIRPNGSPYNAKGDLIILLSKDKNTYKKYVDQIKQLVHKYFQEKPELYVTEYSSVVYSHNYINDSNYQAAFIIKETLDNFPLLNSFSYWLISDVSMEYEDAVDILFGGNGLISRDGIKKPSYHAFSFLGKLGDRLISNDNNYIITSSSKGNYQILAYHYCYFNEEYCDDQDKFKLLRFPTSAFENLPPINLTIQLGEIPQGTYTVRQHSIDQEHGNVLYTWLRLNTPRDLTHQDIEFLKNVSVPAFQIYKKEVADNVMEISCHLNTNNIILIEINLTI